MKAGLDQMADALGIDELIVNTITWDHRARLRSYSLLAEAYGLESTAPATFEPTILTQV